MWIVSQGEFVKNFTSSITNWFSTLYFFRGLVIFYLFFWHFSPQNNRDWLPREFGLKMSRFAPLINLIYQPHAFVNPPAWGNLSIVLLNSENWNSLLTDSLLTYQFGVRAPSGPQNGINEGIDLTSKDLVMFLVLRAIRQRDSVTASMISKTSKKS
jgi:hypothetical protein